MYDCNIINTPFHDFESLEFSTKELYSTVYLWRVEILYKCGSICIVPHTGSEIDINIMALHLRVNHDVLAVKYSKVDVQKIV